ncbi:hypothetical protein PCANC_12216 [Puccinia coronata f. sp. avenae]|uniref:Uncharacterized protein n=1 Tax=Puccinia coronata f. sp. avenae TaxID=200324 RepID=A0A2N5S509_9BASI|nr:hypothetical protein PCANC_26825 [Puccinia coronata f. sp. avenae]PLW48569.1 hypothetical protein PCANC_12216 [Puccinia coronata f. sp. avenae]
MSFSMLLVSMTVGSPPDLYVMYRSEDTRKTVISCSKKQRMELKGPWKNVEHLPMIKEYHSSFPGDVGSLKALKNVDLEIQRAANYEDEEQRDIGIRLITHTMNDGLTTSVAILNPSPLSFTYSLHLVNAKLVIERQEIGDNNLHIATWPNAVEGLLTWYLHEI